MGQGARAFKRWPTGSQPLLILYDVGKSCEYLVLSFCPAILFCLLSPSISSYLFLPPALSSYFLFLLPPLFSSFPPPLFPPRPPAFPPPFLLLGASPLSPPSRDRHLGPLVRALCHLHGAAPPAVLLPALPALAVSRHQTAQGGAGLLGAAISSPSASRRGGPPRSSASPAACGGNRPALPITSQ